MNIELKPCQHCGRIPKIAEYEPFAFAVECECGATFAISSTKEIAAEKWNARKEIDKEKLAVFLHQISQNDIPWENLSKKIQCIYRDRAKWIVEEIAK